jgi:O-antigen ligase
VSLAGTPLSGLTLGEFAAHWSLAAGTVLLLASRNVLSGSRVKLPKSAMLLGLWLTIVSLLAATLSPRGDVSSLLTLLQLLLPVAFWEIGSRIGSHGLGFRLVENFSAVLLVSHLTLLVSNLPAFLGGDAQAVATRFPQYLTYYPGLLAIGLGSAWTIRRRRPFVSLMLGLSIAATAPAIWSRIGLATLVVAGLVGAWLELQPPAGFRASRRFLVRYAQVAVAAGVGIGLLVWALSGTLGTRVETRLVAGSSVFESGRFEFMAEAGGRILASPLAGDFGQARFDRAELGGVEEQGNRVFPSHNQLLDLGLRGGLPAIALGLLMFVSIARGIWRQALDRASPLRTVGVVSFAVLVFASISDLYLSQAITASSAWLMLGSSAGATKFHQSIRQHAESGSTDTVVGRR